MSVLRMDITFLKRLGIRSSEDRLRWNHVFRASSCTSACRQCRGPSAGVFNGAGQQKSPESVVVHETKRNINTYPPQKHIPQNKNHNDMQFSNKKGKRFFFWGNEQLLVGYRFPQGTPNFPFEIRPHSKLIRNRGATPPSGIKDDSSCIKCKISWGFPTGFFDGRFLGIERVGWKERMEEMLNDEMTKL